MRLAEVRDGEIQPVRTVDGVGSYGDFVAQIRSVSAAPRSVAVSLAGFVDSAGHVRLCRHANWAQVGWRNGYTMIWGVRSR